MKRDWWDIGFVLFTVCVLMVFGVLGWIDHFNGARYSAVVLARDKSHDVFAVEVVSEQYGKRAYLVGDFSAWLMAQPGETMCVREKVFGSKAGLAATIQQGACK